MVIFEVICIIAYLVVSLQAEDLAYTSPRTTRLHPVITTAQAQCSCGGGSISLYSYETLPVSSSGAGCIGGCGGGPFEFHDFASPVKVLRAWAGGDHNGLTAIYVQLFNDKTFSAGKIPARGPDASIQFSPGETVVGDIELCGNGIGTRLGFMKFTTSNKQTFQVGSEHTPYYFSSGNSFLTGFFGQSGTEIDHLGLLLMKPISSGQMINVRYPTLDTYSQGLSPQIFKSTLCNDDFQQSQTDTVTFEKTTGESATWSVSTSLTFGASITVTAGVPEVDSVGVEFHWEVGITASHEVSTNTAKTETMQFAVTVPPRERLYASYSWWDSTCNVPYTAQLVYRFTDNTNLTLPVKDMYTGAYITSVTSDFHSVKLNNTESCPHVKQS